MAHLSITNEGIISDYIFIEIGKIDQTNMDSKKYNDQLLLKKCGDKKDNMLDVWSMSTINSGHSNHLLKIYEKTECKRIITLKINENLNKKKKEKQRSFVLRPRNSKKTLALHWQSRKNAFYWSLFDGHSKERLVREIFNSSHILLCNFNVCDTQKEDHTKIV